MELISVLPFMFGLLIMASAAAVLAPAMADGRLPRNGVIGLRTRHTMSSDAAWHRGHVAAAPWLKAAGRIGWVVLPAAAALCMFQLAGWAFAVTAVGYAAFICLILVSTRRANAASREAGGPAR